MAEKIVAVRKNGEGDVVELKTDKGNILGYHEAQALTKSGHLEGVNVFKGRDGDEHLRSNADGDPTNNLDNLPIF